MMKSEAQKIDEIKQVTRRQFRNLEVMNRDLESMRDAIAAQKAYLEESRIEALKGWGNV